MKTDKRGRPVTGAALSNAERQKAYRERMKTEIDTLRAELKSTQTLYDSSVSARGELLKENRKLTNENIALKNQLKDLGVKK